MRSFRSTVLIAVGLLVVTAPAALADSSPPETVVLSVGHRGASGMAPEETLASYDLAMKMHANYLEGDLHLTSDGVLVLLHDSTLDRTAQGDPENCTGPVNMKTLEQVKTCDMGSWFNDAYPKYARPDYVGQKIVTLDEMFQRYGRGANYYLETKDPEQQPGIEEELLRLMDKYDLRDSAVKHWQVLIQSFSPTSLQKIHSLDPELPLIQLLLGGGSTLEQATLDSIADYAVGIGPSSGDVDADLVTAAHERCLDVHPFTVNSPSEMKHLIDLGVDGMFTNFPNRVFKSLGARAVRGVGAASTASSASLQCHAQSNTRSARSVFHRLGCPSPSSSAKWIFPGCVFSSSQVPSGRSLDRTRSIASFIRGSGGSPAERK